MRGKGITSGRRRHRPDGSYYRETRRRRLSGGGGRGMHVRIGWGAAVFALVAIVFALTWMFR